MAGKVSIRGMEGVEGSSPIHPHDSNSMELPPIEPKLELLPPPNTDLNRGNVLLHIGLLFAKIKIF